MIVLSGRNPLAPCIQIRALFCAGLDVGVALRKACGESKAMRRQYVIHSIQQLRPGWFSSQFFSPATMHLPTHLHMFIFALCADFGIEVAPPEASRKSKVKTNARQQTTVPLDSTSSDRSALKSPSARTAPASVTYLCASMRRDDWHEHAPRRGQLGKEVKVEVDVGEFLH